MKKQKAHVTLKDIKKLHQKKYRDELGVFTVEGYKGVWEALHSARNVHALVADADFLAKDSSRELLTRARKNGITVMQCAPRLARQISTTETFPGILAVVERPTCALRDILDDTPVVALDGIGDPGNMGTIIRTAHWFGVRNILLSQQCVDPYAPKVVRSSMGSLFQVRLFESSDILADVNECKRLGYRLCGFSTTGAAIHEMKTPAKTLYVFGSESHGIRPELEACLQERYCIPGNGNAESLNLSVAAGIVLFHVFSCD